MCHLYVYLYAWVTCTTFPMQSLNTSCLCNLIYNRQEMSYGGHIRIFTQRSSFRLCFSFGWAVQGQEIDFCLWYLSTSIREKENWEDTHKGKEERKDGGEGDYVIQTCSGVIQCSRAHYRLVVQKWVVPLVTTLRVLLYFLATAKSYGRQTCSIMLPGEQEIVEFKMWSPPPPKSL